jgi:hypothetical protein
MTPVIDASLSRHTRSRDLIMLHRHSLLFTALSLSLVATACDPGMPNPDEGADDLEGQDDQEDADVTDGDDHLVDDSTDSTDDSMEEPISDLPSEEPTTEACDAAGSSRECPDAAGTQFCDNIMGEQIWGECLAAVDCTLGEAVECFPGDERWAGLMKGCVLVGGVPMWDENACNTPLVLSFSASAPVEMHTNHAAFDIAGAGECLTTDWPAATNPWLVIDLDKNGFIDGGHELFGSGSVLDTGRHASNGFIALSSLDSDHDGRITAADARFDELLVWRDEDGDKLSLAHELSTLAEVGVHDIELDFTVREQCDERGNCGRERSSFGFVGASGKREVGEVVDIHLACQ